MAFPRLSALRLALPALILGLHASVAQAAPGERWQYEWPKTDFTIASVDLADIFSGGPPKDGIPSIDDPSFVPVDEADLPDIEPVIGFGVGDDMRAYPLRVLMWHEIVNDVVGGVPVAVTFCPLCNASMVFDRRVDGQVLDFGTTGKLRHSDLVMYDRQTESWWQQFLGEAIVGSMTGKRLKLLPARIESFAKFRARAPHGKVLIPGFSMLRRYGNNPYEGYDSLSSPWLYRGDMPANIAPLARVVTVAGEAWSLDLLRQMRIIETGDMVITWEPGQASALDTATIANGFDIGNVVVQRKAADGTLEDIAYGVDFAFAFSAFYPDGTIHLEAP
ncbi:MAG: DUF3179 domain-containing protein [Proteobacteria bacterium]|nr:DUF3179 domain-containing protein [Pseudomonadota bacterium]